MKNEMVKINADIGKSILKEAEGREAEKNRTKILEKVQLIIRTKQGFEKTLRQSKEGVETCTKMLDAVEKGKFEFDRLGNFQFTEEELNTNIDLLGRGNWDAR